MADTTAIEWADSTANLWIGCTKISPGCDHCYAEAEWDKRRHRVQWGPHGDRSRAKAGWALIEKFQRAAERNGGVDPELGRRRRIFVNSLSDMFDNHASIIWRGAAWRLLERCALVDITLVTKRPENVAKMVPAHWMRPGGWPPHVWLLVSVEDQTRADHRVPILLSLPVPVKGVSAEPLLGPVDLTGILWNVGGYPMRGALPLKDEPDDFVYWHHRLDGLQWVIVGGESGKGARPMHPDWARTLRDQCADAGTAFLFKQWGEFSLTYDRDRDDPDWRRCSNQEHQTGQWHNLAGGTGFHGERVHYAARVGKKRAGRLLDGVTHDGFPETPIDHSGYYEDHPEYKETDNG